MDNIIINSFDQMIDWLIKSITLEYSFLHTHARFFHLSDSLFIYFFLLLFKWEYLPVRLKIVFVTIVEWEMDRVRSKRDLTQKNSKNISKFLDGLADSGHIRKILTGRKPNFSELL